MKREWIRTALTSIAIASVVGCASMSDFRYESTQKARAAKQYIQCGKPKCEKFPHDYKLGWLDGFYAISTGGPECPPAVAPARYWNVKQQLEDCDGRRRSYYSGWQDGAARAIQFPDTHHLKIFETCECTVPRCDLPCASGACGPCGANIIGSPVHQELIETPYDYQEQAMEPLVPPAPAAPFDSDADDEDHADADDQAGDSEESSDEQPASTVDEPESDEEVPAVPEPDPQASDVDDFSAVPGKASQQVAELKTEELVDQHVEAAGRTRIVRQHDADSLFGSAFDLASSRNPTVKHQATDPAELIEEATDVKSSDEVAKTVDAAENKVETTQTKVETAKTKIETVAPKETLANVSKQDTTEKATALLREDQPTEGLIVPVTPPSISSEVEMTANEKLKQEEPKIVVPKAMIKQVDSAPVQHAETIQLTQSDLPSDEVPVAAKAAAVQRDVNHHTVPVVFEMIESDTDAVKLAQ